MGKGYNLYNLEPQFKQFLVAENISPISLKNYLSDFRYFAGWLELYNRKNQVSSESESHSIVETDKSSLTLKQIDHNTVLSYRSYLASENLPHKTINRRLSTLRKFCSFCISQGWMTTNPAKKIANITPENALPIQQSEESNNNKAFAGPKNILNFISFITERYRSFAHNTPPTSKLNIQYYIGFLILLVFASVLGAGIYNQFFLKTTTTLAYPTALTRAGRILSFQGRLTDTVGNPITTATNVTYSLYDVTTGGSPIYTSGACSTTPDQDGIINVLIGGSGYTPTPPTSTYNTVCGSEIDASIFTENANVYLGVTVASDAEMTPRQQIANVGYAINSETLQGFPPGTEVSTIPYINSDGNVLIAASTPGIYSTYSSSTFTLSSANATTIQSAGTGDITLQATESGAISFRTGGDTSTYTRLFIDTLANGGNVGIGDLTPVATLTVGDGDLFQVAGATGNITTAGDIAINGGDITSTATTFNFGIGNTGTLNFKDGTNTLAAIKDQGDYAFWNMAGKSTTGDPATCSPGDIYYNSNDETIKICHTGNAWEELDGGGSSVWSDLLAPTA
ncbi:MAG: phage integrase SAM-like domain-containing protein, partial [Methylococcales bacterium]|nr:phage integrase SAM-like domain-containing protein [Methylococcales bacterium]